MAAERHGRPLPTFVAANRCPVLLPHPPGAIRPSPIDTARSGSLRSMLSPSLAELVQFVTVPSMEESNTGNRRIVLW